jgi:predicted CXXCH cytochrome family protein
MKGAWQDRSLPLIVGLLMLVATSGLLLAQTGVDEKSSPTTGSETLVADTTASPSESGEGADSNTGIAENTVREQRLRGLIGSKHDFRRTDESARDVCATCHMPHLGGVPTQLSDDAGQPGPLRPYKGIEVELDGWSLLCLGCHDGTTAPDVYTTSHATTLASQLANSRLGVRGLRSHPVGIRYSPDDVEKYHPRAAVEAAGLKLPNGCIQCTTCHDPHNESGHAGMLKSSNHRSRLCLTCHRL